MGKKKCYCPYCDVYLIHNSLRSRRDHSVGFRHIANFSQYYAKFLPEFFMNGGNCYFDEEGNVIEDSPSRIKNLQEETIEIRPETIEVPKVQVSIPVINVPKPVVNAPSIVPKPQAPTIPKITPPTLKMPLSPPNAPLKAPVLPIKK